MARRSKLETAISSFLALHGWEAPSLRVQSTAFPGVTPAYSSSGGKGRAAVVLDVEKVDDSSGIVISYVAGIKAAATRKSTITVTTGREEHLDAVISAAERGLSIPIFVVAVNAKIEDSNEDPKIIDHGPISVAVVNVGDAIRQHGVKQRTQGQGKGKGQAHAVAWGEKIQRSAAGKEYRYVSLQANLPACGVKWQTFDTLADLAEFISANAEGIPL